MQCDYFDAWRCRSCTLMGRPYAAQLADKDEAARAALGERPGLTWLPPQPSREQGFRNKAKMVVAGTAAEPTLGILDSDGRGVDLRGCGLYTPGIHAVLPALAAFVTRAGIEPYDVPARRGELKNVLVTESPDGDLMVRFVLRSQEPVARIRKHLPGLADDVSRVGGLGLRLAVCSVNLLPGHRAVVEGEREILLTGTADAGGDPVHGGALPGAEASLRMRVNGLDLHLRPQSFFQTNTEVAAALYRQATAWVGEVAPASVWDLYCGVGGFALHVAGAEGPSPVDVLGVEISTEAVASARLTARDADLADVRFEAGDATAFALASDDVPDLVVVNPPRRGVGPDLAAWLEGSGVRHVVYSSCNPASLAKDLDAMPSLRPVRARLFDMFPQTGHAEVLTLLSRS
ncbi:23S rRNA (uracil(747)-C(5))-methyltransferase [Paraoerskovia sediminicola]|uniref:23S rRNA (Uracil(747)-C(5))-methyltransferase n=1 Tax=Paraoerskovia sediminicola TaxID=1138587 RepID=A0ABM8G1I0_9CELL|nr:23S rRNA (uracil(747)-C(5))-methyltransferase RlmC [Paraoerskovia sediminicola]BDZ41863.1 23S rRNA (uracil(747)-C(5))-methyltransferase [Paraoerskovia sediminicola]